MADPSDRTALQTPSMTPSDTKSPSCAACQKRKVKCDRKNPCSACVKHGVECIYRAHLPSRRHKRQRSEDSHGPVRAGPRRANSFASRLNQTDSPTLTTGVSSVLSRPEPGMLITGGGKSVYRDNNVWTGVRNELPGAEDLSDSGEDDLSQDDDETSLLLGPSTKTGLAALHPSPLHIFKLWQTFLENVNPLVKILHVPSLQQQILEATGNLALVSKEFETLMFSIYFIALISLGEDDVQSAFGGSKTLLLSRYRRGARLAFSNAGILRTSSIVVLQAFVLYLISLRTTSNAQSAWTLCGVAMRMAQRIGLHRDGSRHDLSVFDTEMRRRLWLQLSILDATTAHSAGVVSHSPLLGEVQSPSNTNDSDLDPRMTDKPREHDGATEMMFCLARNEFGQWLMRWSKATGGPNGAWSFLASSSLTLAGKDRAVDELSTALESKFLRHCDNSIPLHHMTAILIKTVVCQMRFTVHHPRQYGTGSDLTPPERDQIFSICLQVAEMIVMAQTNTITQRYAWHMENHIPWDALIYMLHELQRRINDEETRTAWHLIDQIYSRQYRQLNRVKSPLHVAMQRLIIKAWDAHTAERARQRQPSLPCPNIVSLILEKMKSRTPDDRSEIVPVAQPESLDIPEVRADDPPLECPGESDFIEPGDFDMSPMDWVQWDGLLEQFQQQFTNID